MSKIIKPITIAREDFKNSLITLCNDSELPFFCIEDILKDLIQQVHAASLEQYQRDKGEYENKKANYNAKKEELE